MLNQLIAHFGARRTRALLDLSPNHVGLIRAMKLTSLPIRKHVWTYWALLLRPDGVRSTFEFLSCGRWTRYSGPQHALRGIGATFGAVVSENTARSRRGAS